MRRSMTLVLVLSTWVPAVALGQTCLGLPSFSRVPAHLSGTLTTGGDLTTIGGALTWGSTGPFASAGLNYVDIDGVDESAFSFGGAVGYQMTANTGGRLRPSASYQASSNVRALQWCPIASIEYQKGPEFDVLGEDIDLSTLTLGGGVSLGVPIVAGTNLQVIPTGGAALAYTKISADAGSFGSGSDSDTYGVISLGLGFLMNESFAVKPYVAIPVGLEGADARLGITVSFGLGRK